MLTVRANAKINLLLDVVSRREDGYHNISSVMQSVSLCDLVSVNYDGNQPFISVSMTINGNDSLPTDYHNLCVRGAERFLHNAGKTGKVEIILQKNIPVEAGLGGGSADCAATLLALNQLTGYPLSTVALMEVGAQLGADVPFCIVGGTAFVTGIGDRVRSIHNLPNCTFVIAKKGKGISTPLAYAELDKLNNNYEKAIGNADLPRGFATSLTRGKWEKLFPHFKNVFEPIAMKDCPDVVLLKHTMLENGADFSMMSGSGPSVFGIYRDDEKANKTLELLQSMGATAYICKPMKGNQTL